MEYEVRYEVESCVRRYHVYQAIWTPVIGETLKCQKEPNNLADQYGQSIYHVVVFCGTKYLRFWFPSQIRKIKTSQNFHAIRYLLLNYFLSF